METCGLAFLSLFRPRLVQHPTLVKKRKSFDVVKKKTSGEYHTSRRFYHSHTVMASSERGESTGEDGGGGGLGVRFAGELFALSEGFCLVESQPIHIPPRNKTTPLATIVSFSRL